jgi:ribosome biogenesis GTPase
MDAFEQLLANKVTLLSGHSGVGKTTLVNAVYPHLNLKTQQLSGYSGKGQHTTTFASMHPIPGGGFLIDTPGIKELSPVDLTMEEVSHYLPEMRELLDDCQFNNCLHIDEPGCAVKQALDEGKIPFSRYENYVHIVFDLKDKKSW